MSPTVEQRVERLQVNDGPGISPEALTVERMVLSGNDRLAAAYANRERATELVDDKAERILTAAIDKASSRTATVAGEGSVTTVRGGGSINEIEAHARETVTVALNESGIDHGQHGHLQRQITDEIAYRAKAQHGSVETEILRRAEERKTEVADAAADEKAEKVPHGKAVPLGDRRGQREGIPHGEGEAEVAALSEEHAAQRGKILTAGIRAKGVAPITTDTETGAILGVDHAGPTTVVAGLAARAHTTTATEGESPTTERRTETLAERRDRISRRYDELASKEVKDKEEIALTA